eukprot:s128_g20.t1
MHFHDVGDNATIKVTTTSVPLWGGDSIVVNTTLVVLASKLRIYVQLQLRSSTIVAASWSSDSKGGLFDS